MTESLKRLHDTYGTFSVGPGLTVPPFHFQDSYFRDTFLT